jgi:hypothetical protein
MAIPKKGLRKIVVNGQHYQWIAKGNDGYIDLIICDSTRKGQLLRTSFHYYHTLMPKEWGYHIVPGSQFVITPSVVEEVIVYGLAQGWTLLKRGGSLGLAVEETIDAVGRWYQSKALTTT